MTNPTFEQWIQSDPDVDVPASDVAVLVVDMQNLMLDPKSSLNDAGIGTDVLREAIPGCQRLVSLARAAGQPVIFIRIVRMPDAALDSERQSRLHFYSSTDDPEPGTEVEFGAGWDAQIVPELEVLEGDYLLDKPFGSSFVATRLDALLTGLGVRNLVVCGTTTNMCVENSARHSSEHGYGTYVVRDAVGEFEKSRGDHALYTMDMSVGRVVDLDDIERSWAAAAAAAALSTPEPVAVGA